MDQRRYAPCNLSRNTICLGKQGEGNALRIEFDCSAWLAEYPDAVIVLYYFAPDRPQDDPIKPVLGIEGTDRVWLVSETDTANAGNGVIELVLEDAFTAAKIKSATGYTTVRHSPSALLLASDEEDGSGTGTGEDGGYYKPSVSSVGDLSWTPSKSGMPSVPTVNIKGPKGDTGATGETGPQGEAGPAGAAGADGFSPTITVTTITGGHRVTITDADGSKYFDVMNGTGTEDGSGAAGADGFSPIVSVIAIDGGHRISITDATGTSEFDVMDGEDGAQGPEGETGPQGPAGADGVGATASVVEIEGGHRVTIVSAGGTVSFDVMDGKDGAAGEGASVELDTTLTQSGQAADAAVVGEKLNELKEANDAQDAEIARKANDADLTNVAKSGSYSDLTNKPSINGVELAGNKTLDDLGIGAPTDDQVSGAVQTWLDEHPEATTTVADGSITPPKLSFYKSTKETMSLGDLDFSESISGTSAKEIGLYYGGRLSESIAVNGNFSIMADFAPSMGGTYAHFAPVYYDADGAWLKTGNTSGADYLRVSEYKEATGVPLTLQTYFPPEGAASYKWYVHSDDFSSGTHANVKYLIFSALPQAKPWVSDDVVDMLTQNTSLRGDQAIDYALDTGHWFQVPKTTDYSTIDFLPHNYTEIRVGQSGTQDVALCVFLQPIETNGHTEFYLAVKGSHDNDVQLKLYGQHGFFAYDENWNPLTAFSLQYAQTDHEYVNAEKLLTDYSNDDGVYYYKITVDPSVKYLLPVTPNRYYTYKYNYGPFNPLLNQDEIDTFEAPVSVQNYVKDIMRPEWYRFKQIGRLVDNGGCNYVAWNHNTLHYDAIRNKYVMTMRGAEKHGGSTHRVKFVKFDPATLEATTADIVINGVTADWVNGFTVDDNGNYYMVCHLSDVQHYVTSTDGGETWVDGGAVVVDTSAATNADTTTYNYAKFFDIHRLSTGTLLASYDDTVSPTNKSYSFIARSTDGVNWTLIELTGRGACEMAFYEHGGTVMMLGRHNSYGYSITDNVTGYSHNNADISYSYDDGITWGAITASVSVRANVQNISVREHDGVVELMAVNRDFDKYPRGYIYHYTAIPEEALADRFTLREVFQCNAYGAGDVTGAALAFDRYGHALFAYSDNHGTNSNYDYLHFLYGARAEAPMVCADGVTSEFLPYSGQKVQALIDALDARVKALEG